MTTWRRFGSLAAACVLAPLVAQAEETDPNAPHITFVGFSARGNVANVYVDIDRAINVSKSQNDGTVSYSLPGAVIDGRNNKRVLPTKVFGTPVVSVQLRQTEDGAALVLRVEDKPIINHRMIRGESGARLSVTASPAASPTP